MSRLTKQTADRELSRPSATYTRRSAPFEQSAGRYALAAIVVVALLQIAFLTIGCDWDFCGDEAEYWAWSRRLDWSYFSRGPLIAWLIRLATEVFGSLSMKWTGSLMLAARLPAVILSAATGWGVFRLATLTLGSGRSALVTVLILPAIPVLAIGGVIMTSDTPLVCCWVWAAVWTYRAVLEDDLRGWLAAAAIGVVGVLAKYSFLAFPASVGLFLLLTKSHRQQLWKPGFWVMSAVSTIGGLAPIVLWNAAHGWVGAGQLADRVGLSTRSMWGHVGPLITFLGGEAATLGGIWWLIGIITVAGALARVVRTARQTQSAAADRSDSESQQQGLMYLLCLWGVTWTACVVAAVLGETEANWMAPGYLALVVLIGARVEKALARGGLRVVAYVTAWCLSIMAVIAIHHTEWLYPAIARFVPPSVHRWPAPLRLYEPTARLRGHRKLAEIVARKLDAYKAQGITPFVLTPTYALTSTLEFYLPDHPETYCLAWNFGMTPQPVNQHDLWHPNPRHDPEAFRGRPALVVEDGMMPPNYAKLMVKKGVFGRNDEIDRIFVEDHGVIVGSWDITLCYDYRGTKGYKQNGMKQQ
jgi:hypothetical protein